MLATTTNNHPDDWEHYVRKVCMAYNSSVHSSTGFSPFFLMFGREAKLPVDLMYGSNPMETKPVADYALQLKRGLQNAYALVREHCKAEHKRQKVLYDEKVHGKPFNPGDMVWLLSPAIPRGQSKKLHLPWKGPFKVIERLGDCVYKIKGPRSYQCVHFDRLKPYLVGENFQPDDDLPSSREQRSISKNIPSTAEATPAPMNYWMMMMTKIIVKHYQLQRCLNQHLNEDILRESTEFLIVMDLTFNIERRGWCNRDTN